MLAVNITHAILIHCCMQLVCSKRIYFALKEFKMKVLVILFVSLSLFKSCGKQQKTATTNLTIVQGSDSVSISDNTHNITLQSAPFKFVFQTKNADKVYLSCSFDSTAYNQVLNNQKDSLTCFHSPQTFSEKGGNPDNEIFAVKNINRGYHCLFAYNEIENLIRFDSVHLKNPDDWTGVRSVDSILVLPGSENLPISTLKDKHIYFVFSPSREKDGHALRVDFE